VQVGAAEGGSVTLPKDAPVSLALWGAFQDVSPVVQALAGSRPTFQIPITNEAMRGDPVPGHRKALALLIMGGRNHLEELAMDHEGSTLRVDVSGRVTQEDKCCIS
jgi:hypothetical protein